MAGPYWKCRSNQVRIITIGILHGMPLRVVKLLGSLWQGRCGNSIITSAITCMPTLYAPVCVCVCVPCWCRTYCWLEHAVCSLLHKMSLNCLEQLPLEFTHHPLRRRQEKPTTKVMQGTCFSSKRTSTVLNTFHRLCHTFSIFPT